MKTKQDILLAPYDPSWYVVLADHLVLNKKYNVKTYGTYSRYDSENTYEFLDIISIDDKTISFKLPDNKPTLHLSLPELSGIVFTTCADLEWHNSHGVSYTKNEFMDIEVIERENYSLEQAETWFEKHEIKDNDRLIWVTDEETCISLYGANPDDDTEISEIKKIMFDISDGDGGFIAVLGDKK